MTTSKKPPAGKPTGKITMSQHTNRLRTAEGQKPKPTGGTKPPPGDGPSRSVVKPKK